MKKALIIAHTFPPQSGPGVHRSKNIAKYLHHFGYEPIILTVSLKSLAGNNTDDSLFEDLPKDLKVYRTRSYSLKKTVNFLIKLKIFRLFWFFLYPIFWESSSLWPFFTYRKAKKIIEKHDIDVVYTSSGPFASLILGRMLQKKIKIPWVADLRDPYTDAYAWQFPSYYHWQYSRKWEKKILSKPSKLIVNTPEVKKLFLKREISSENKIVVINNGF